MVNKDLKDHQVKKVIEVKEDLKDHQVQMDHKVIKEKLVNKDLKDHKEKKVKQDQQVHP